MKIGIITFHWATNYGAILQAFCLQEYLRGQGHEVEIINYKPKQYDFSFFRLLLNKRRLKNIKIEIRSNRKENLLVPFRKKFLNLTNRFRTCKELMSVGSHYDAVISGSDQILNPFFAQFGENGKPSFAYFLGFASDICKKIGYAISFGCTSYPMNARIVVKDWINNFDTISTREKTGLHVLDELEYKGLKQTVPDPTILLGKELFYRIGVEIPTTKSNYTCVYMLRSVIKVEGDVKFIDEQHTPLTMEQWLTTISHASCLITNSYHGMIMAILSHVPFVVLVENGKAAGMNDRFDTLLSHLGLASRIATTIDDAKMIVHNEIDFAKVDCAIVNYQQVGKDYLMKSLQ